LQIRILVADDSASDRLIIKHMLKEFNILTARDGMETIQMLNEHDGINILILDLNMPNMNGFEVLEVMRNHERYRKVRTIILTNQEELDNEIRGLKLGAIDFIRKPIHMASLKARIDVHVALLRAEQALEQKLINKTITFDMIYEQAPIGIAISHSCDPNHCDEAFIRVNSAFEQITGRTQDEITNLGWAKITHPDDVDEDIENFRKLQNREIESYSMEKRYIKPDGSIVWVHMVVAGFSSVENNTHNHICIIQDIMERKQIELERKYINEHQRLTGLYNCDYFEVFFADDIKQRKSLKRALVGINLSNIQSVTVNYGLIYTHDLIKRAAEVLKQYCTDNRLLIHPHENRFLFYVTNYKDKNELTDFCDTIAQALKSLFVMGRTGGSIGVLEIEEDENDLDVDSLLRRLLVATERSISMFGKNFESCFYDEELEALVIREREIMESLSAIAENKNSDSDLFLQYQPILDLRTNSICGFEALARLNTEKFGLVSPAEFIPIAEKTKLIVPIGEIVIVKAFHFINKLKELGYDKTNVALNISAIQLLSPDFADTLFELIGKMQIDLRHIIIEITESVFASDYKKVNNIIHKLRDAGLQIAIDDFGTGYSSLARENELYADSLKIDKYFMDKLIDADIDKAIASDIISMAHKLGQCVIAEGVEYEIQLQYLKKHGCDKIQGYLISRPLDEKPALEFIEKYSKDYGCL
jgi:PAS domain S-box-containing protein